MLSIVTSTLNSVQYIETNINSVLNLKIPFHHIIVDRGSTDGTLTLLEKFTHLIIIHQKEKLGMYQAIDMSFKIAKGDIII